MANPWLTIPEADYVGHMSSPAVGQRAVLSRVLGDTLQETRPEALLVIGCSNGNGFEHIDSNVTKRVTAVDINGGYLRSLRRADHSAGYDLECRCADILECEFPALSFDLIHAALVLEYLDWRVLISRAAAWLRPGGILSVVLQRPSPLSPAVTPTSFTTLLVLETIFHFVEPDDLLRQGRDAGLELFERGVEPLPGGKAFDALRLVKTGRWQSAAAEEAS